MDSKIDLEDILSKYSPAVRNLISYGQMVDYPVNLQRILVNGGDAIEAMKEVWNTAVDECKKQYDATINENGNFAHLGEDIEQVKQMIKCVH